MKPGINLDSLSNQDLSELEQQILAEQSRRVMSSPTTIVVEPDAREEVHREVIALLLANRQKHSTESSGQ
jgi:hypothetical protein